MKSKIILVSTIACMSLIFSACGSDSSSGPNEPIRTNPNQQQPVTGQTNGNNNNASARPQIQSPPLNVQMSAQDSAYLEFLTINEALDRGYPLNLTGAERGILILKPNSYVQLLVNGEELNFSTLSYETEDLLWELYHTDITVVSAQPFDEQVAQSPIQQLDKEGFAIVKNNKDTQVIASSTNRNNSNGDSNLSVLPRDLQITNQGTGDSQQLETGSMQGAEVPIDIGMQVPIDSNAEKVELPGRIPVGQLPGQPAMGTAPTPDEALVPVPLWKKVGSLGEYSLISKKDCSTQADIIMGELFAELNVDQILTNRAALKALRCVARSASIQKVTRLYNRITNLNTRDDMIDIIKAINVPVLALMAGTVKSQKDLALDLLDALQAEEKYNYWNDMSYGVMYLQKYQSSKYYDLSTRNALQTALTDKLTNYRTESGKKYAVEPLARLLRLASSDKEMLKEFYKSVLGTSKKKNVSDNRLSYLADIFRKTAVLLTESDCIVYHITEKQASAFKSVYGRSLYNDFVDQLEAKKAKRVKREPSKDSNSRCELLDYK